MSTLKTLTVNGTTYNVAQVVPKASVVLRASGWVGNAGSYSQVVTLAGVTSHTKVDLQTTPEQDEIFYNKTLAFVAENNNGVVTVFSIGTVPQNDYTIQVTLTEVEGKAPIRGNTVGLPNPQPDWGQTDHTKADFIKNKPNIVKTFNGISPDENGNVEVEFAVDNTLKESDAAANAKAVGDALTYAGRNLVNTADPIRSITTSNMEAKGKTIILSYKGSGEAYFSIYTTENLVQGEQYVFSFDCAGVPADMQGKNFSFKVGNPVSQFTLFNGRVVVPFKAAGNSGYVFIDDVAGSSNRPTASIVGDGIVLSNFSVEKGSFSAGYRHNEQEYDRLRIPVLTTTQKAEIQALAKSYYDVGQDDDDLKLKATFHYNTNMVRNSYANNRCYDPYGECDSFALCCNTFVEMLWMGRDVKDFVGKNKDTYSNKITKAFDWGYYFDFNDRKKIAGATYTDDDGNKTYYGFRNPNADKTNFKNSYSINSYFDYELADTDANREKYPKLNKLRSFMNANDVAQELYRMGCEIPYEELDIGDLVFTRPRYDLNTEAETFFNKMCWKNIGHVVMVYDKAADGTLAFIDCSKHFDDYKQSIYRSSTRNNHVIDISKAINIMSNIVMCARHPAAWGKSNMENVDSIDYVPMRETSGYSIGQAKPFTAGMDVTEGLWYVYDNQLGKALTTGNASEWTSTYFDIQYKNYG